MTAHAWTCEAHRVTTTGDCPRCDDELVALTEEAEHRDDLAAKIAHTLACTRCRMGWTCGGLGEDDYEAGERIVRLLDTRATAADTVLAEARRLCCGDNPAPHHAATDAHSQRMAFAEELARAVRGS